MFLIVQAERFLLFSPLFVAFNLVRKLIKKNIYIYNEVAITPK